MNRLINMLDVHKEYSLGKFTVHALKGISLSISKGEFVCLAGPSGSGKSTFLNLVGCLDKPTRGGIFINEKDISSLSDNQQSEFRNLSIGFIFQSFNLIPVLNIFENVEFPILFRTGAVAMPASERRKLVEEIIEKVGLTKFVKHRPKELSGGQQQRVAIARSLVTQPKIVLADEPTANIDSENAERILTLMSELNQKEGTTFVFATHDQQVMQFARRVIKLKDGSVIEDTKNISQGVA